MGCTEKENDTMTQYEVNHMENIMVRNDYWWDDEDEEDP